MKSWPCYRCEAETKAETMVVRYVADARGERRVCGSCADAIDRAERRSDAEAVLGLCDVIGPMFQRYESRAKNRKLAAIRAEAAKRANERG